MRYDSWVAASRDGTMVRYAYKELSDGIAGISGKRRNVSHDSAKEYQGALDSKASRGCL